MFVLDVFKLLLMCHLLMTYHLLVSHLLCLRHLLKRILHLSNSLNVVLVLVNILIIILPLPFLLRFFLSQLLIVMPLVIRNGSTR
jgi:hypothetical protein